MKYCQLIVHFSLVCSLTLITACGGGSDSSDAPTPQPTPINTSPTVSAGGDQTVTSDNSVTLTGTATDSDGTVSAVSWAQTSGPTVTLSSPSSLSTNFERPYSGQAVSLSFTLTATDNDGASVTDDVDITISASQTKTGKFANVSGLQYTSGTLSGMTASDGEFSYLDGASISFNIGNVVLGSALGADIITPLVLSFDENDSTVYAVNLLRFLSSLDADGDNGNGITLSDEVIAVATNWVAIDFSSQEFDTLVASIIADIEMADSRTVVLASPEDAQTSLEINNACLASGVYQGTFSGTDNGTFVLLVEPYRSDIDTFGTADARVGTTSAAIYSSLEQEFYFTGFNENGLSIEGDRAVIAGSVETGATFAGTFTSPEQLSGTWQNQFAGDSGTFIGEKFGSTNSAIYRLSGLVLTDNLIPAGDNAGAVSVEVFSDNTAAGVYTLANGTRILLSGNYSSDLNLISVTGPNMLVNFVYTRTADDALEPGLGFFVGRWEGGGLAGSVAGFSCQLNPT